MYNNYTYQPRRLQLGDTICGSGGEWKFAYLLILLGVAYEHCPNGVQSAPDFLIRCPGLKDIFGECKRSLWVHDASNNKLSSQEKFSYLCLVELSREKPVAIIEDFSKFTWLIDGVLLYKDTLNLDQAFVEFYGKKMVEVRSAIYKTLDMYSVARTQYDLQSTNDNSKLSLVG